MNTTTRTDARIFLLEALEDADLLASPVVEIEESEEERAARIADEIDRTWDLHDLGGCGCGWKYCSACGTWDDIDPYYAHRKEQGGFVPASVLAVWEAERFVDEAWEARLWER